MIFQIGIYCRLFLLSSSYVIENNSNEDDAKQFLEEYNEDYGVLLNGATKGSWNYETNITDENALESQTAWLKYLNSMKQLFKMHLNLTQQNSVLIPNVSLARLEASLFQKKKWKNLAVCSKK